MAGRAFYRIDSRNITLREYGFGTPGWLLPFAGLLKLLRVPLPSSSDDPPVETLAPFETQFEDFPADVRERFEPLAAELLALGFHSPVFHFVDDILHRTKIYWATWAHSSGEAAARIHYRIWNNGPKPKRYLFCNFISAFQDGSFLVSSSGKADLIAPALVRILRLEGATFPALWEMHLRELAREKTSRSLYRSALPEDIRAITELVHAVTRDFHLNRKVFRRLSAAEEREVSEMQEALRIAQGSGTKHPEVLAEIEKLQRKRASWTSVLVLLIVSLAAFVAAGLTTWNWEFLWIILGVLLIHELGHWVAMKLFNYRNLRMFFIPFFGAAVSGRNYNVAGWKKVVVSLMGPVPGIVIGVALAVVGMAFPHPLIDKTALVFIIVNGLNLLPILPLDGGWVMHTVLFSRHQLLDVTFRAFAVAGLAFWGVYGRATLMMYLSIPMALSLPANYKTARITNRLRKETLPTVSPDDQSIPMFTAERIIDELKSAFAKSAAHRSPAILAQNTVSIFESLNARPPGWGLSGIFTIVQFGSIAACVVIVSLLMVARQHGTTGLLNLIAQHVRYTLACDRLPEAGGQAVPVTVVATFSDETVAEKQAAELGGAGANIRLFGQTALVGIAAGDDAARREALARLEPFTTNLFVHKTNFLGSLSLTCKLPTESEAEALVRELNLYFGAAEEYAAAPPWLAVSNSTPDTLRAQRFARATLKELRAGSWSYVTNAEYKELAQKRAAAARRGETTAAEELEAEENAIEAKLKKQRLNRMRESGDYDPDLIALFEKLPGPSSTNEADPEIKREIAERLGSYGEDTAAQKVAALWGIAEASGRDVALYNVTFRDIFHGPTELVRWLCSSNASQFLYSFHPPDDLSGEE